MGENIFACGDRIPLSIGWDNHSISRKRLAQASPENTTPENEESKETHTHKLFAKSIDKIHHNIHKRKRET